MLGHHFRHNTSPEVCLATARQPRSTRDAVDTLNTRVGLAGKAKPTNGWGYGEARRSANCLIPPAMIPWCRWHAANQSTSARRERITVVIWAARIISLTPNLRPPTPPHGRVGTRETHCLSIPGSKLAREKVQEQDNPPPPTSTQAARATLCAPLARSRGYTA